MAWAKDEGRLFNHVQTILTDFDPEALLTMEETSGVYDLVAYRVTKALFRLPKCPKAGEVANVLALSLHISFGDWQKPITYRTSHQQMGKILAEAID
jgi:hypothetical protein